MTQYGEPEIDRSAFENLGRALAGCCRVCGVKPSLVRGIAPGYAIIEGAGVSVVWSADGYFGAPGWSIRETYEIEDGDGGWKHIYAVVSSAPESEWARAAKLAVLLVIERRIDAKLDSMASIH